MQKTSHSINFFLRYSKYQSPATRVSLFIFDHAYPSIFQSTVNFHELESTLKNQAISSFYSRDIINSKILQSGWPRAFWPYQIFPVYGIREEYTLEFWINGTPRLLMISFFATLPNLIQYSPFVNFGEFCQPTLLFQTPRLLIHVHSRQQ